jgi:CheY-like chemotaxis protein
MVRGLGYDVVNVADARGALELLRQFPRHVRLLLSDVLMPGMDGGELAERARALRPDLWSAEFRRIWYAVRSASHRLATHRRIMHDA